MQHFIRFLFIFSLVYLTFSLFGISQQEKKYEDDVVIFAKDEVTLGSDLQITVLNNTEQVIAIDNNCQITPLITERYINGQWKRVSTARVNKNNCADVVKIPAGEKRLFSYVNESLSLFPEFGKYRVKVELKKDFSSVASTETDSPSVTTEADSPSVISTEAQRSGEISNNTKGKTFEHNFEVVKPGFFRSLWDNLVYAPIYNLLFWLLTVVPGYSLGLAIIVLTIIIKTALLAPNHKALKSQKALQKVQPELQKIKDKYKGDQARIAQETMALWKKYKINPAGSCLPILLQFPFLIAIFFILQNGLTSNNAFYLYDMMKGFDYTLINSQFLIMDLSNFGPIYLGVLVGLAQYYQMKLSFSKNKPVSTGGDMMAEQMQKMTKIFIYLMPGMIAIFTLTVPAGVGLYWLISTIYSVGQQYFINLNK